MGSKHRKDPKPRLLLLKLAPELVRRYQVLLTGRPFPPFLRVGVLQVALVEQLQLSCC